MSIEEGKRGPGRPRGSKNQPKQTVTTIVETQSVVRERRGLSVKEFAAVYGLSVSMVQNEIRAGRLVAHKVGDRSLILDDDERAWRHGLAKRAKRSLGRGAASDGGVG
jgi:hypothetical protein